MASVHPGFTLSQLIRTAAGEIRAARNQTDDAVMEFSSCEIELAVTVQAEAGGGIKFWLVDASVKTHAETVSKVKLSFGAVPGKSIQFALLSAEAKSDPGPAVPKRRKKE